MDMRRIITLIESAQKQQIDEIDIGGGLDNFYVDELSDKNYQNDHAEFAGQHELFPGMFPDLAKLHGTLKPPYKTLGKIDGFLFGYNPEAKAYVMFDDGRAIAWVAIKDAEDQASIASDFLEGEGGQVGGIFVRQEYQGRQLGMKMYHFLLTHVYDYLFADNTQTLEGQNLWRKMLKSPLFDVEVWDHRKTDSVPLTGRNFRFVYTSNHSFELVPWVTLAGKSHQIRTGEKD